MLRREALGIFAVGGVGLLAGCSGSTIEGSATTEGTPLAIDHDYDMQSTYSGLIVIVSATADYQADTPMNPEERFLAVTCTFQNGDGDVLHEAGRLLKDPIDPGETIDLEFRLGIDVDEAKRYELRAEWRDGEETDADG